MHVSWLWAAACGLALGVTSPFASAQSEPPPAKKPTLRRVVHSIELAAHKEQDFTGRLTLRVAAPQSGPLLEYYWGGKCKGSKLTTTRLELLYEAMREGYTVEVPSRPMKHDGRIYMCIQAIRVIKP